MSYDILTGDCLTHMATVIPARSVHCVVTSPPYLGLRDYGIPGRNWADGWQGVFGNEPSLPQYITHTLEVFEGLRRVLRPDGVIWWNMGDTYSSGGRQTYDSLTPGKNKACNGHRATITGTAHAGNKLLIPHRVAIALQDAGWCIRQDAIWAKPSPMPESISGWSWKRCQVKVASKNNPQQPYGLAQNMGRKGQIQYSNGGGKGNNEATWQPCPGCAKCEAHDGYILRQGQWRNTTAHEVIFQITQGENYFCDAQAVAEPAVYARSHRESKQRGAFVGKGSPMPGREPFRCITETRNPRSVWHFSSESYAGAHFATFPTELPYRCIRAATSSAGVCPTCGSQYAPVIEKVRRPSRPGETTKVQDQGDLVIGNRDPQRHITETVVIDYRPSCDCPARPPIPATVYDPFGGSLTTLQVAHWMGRHGTASEISDQYRALGLERIQKRPRCCAPAQSKQKRRRILKRQQTLFTPPGASLLTDPSAS